MFSEDKKNLIKTEKSHNDKYWEKIRNISKNAIALTASQSINGKYLDEKTLNKMSLRTRNQIIKMLEKEGFEFPKL